MARAVSYFPPCPECDNVGGTNSVLHANGCPQEASLSMLMGCGANGVVEICVDCGWKDGYHAERCARFGS